MIGWLKGQIIEKFDDAILLNVQDVGYIVSLSQKNLHNIAIGEDIALFTELLVRENEMRLFGFASLKEKNWFLLLTTVQGVGPKVAMAIISLLTPSALLSALLSQDKNAFTQVSGVGPKMANRIVNELKDKIPADLYDVQNLNNAPIPALEQKPTKTSKQKVQIIEEETDIQHNAVIFADATSALENLGYQRSDIFQAFEKIDKENVESTQNLIRLALKALAQS